MSKDTIVFGLNCSEALFAVVVDWIGLAKAESLCDIPVPTLVFSEEK